MEDNRITRAYQVSQQLKPLFDIKSCSSSLPLTYEDSLSPVPDHPSCAIGTLTSQAAWGSKKGVAFVVEDNYILTCASNCYSHQHGIYPSITFTIKSHRKHGYDTQKVSKVFIPQQYKRLPQNERKEFNYALLYIEGETNMKDRYGSIGIGFKIVNSLQESMTNKCAYQSMQLQQYEPLILDGEPYIRGDKAVGLLYFEGEDFKPFYLRFDENVHSQLAQWVKVPKEQFCLQYLSADEMNASCLKDKQILSIKRIDLSDCEISERFCTFFEEIPFFQISELYCNGEKDYRENIRENLSFLKLSKLKDIKILQLHEHGLGPKACEFIASLPLCNIRELSLSNNPIGDQGCRYISKADWPFLGRLFLNYCKIENYGLRFCFYKKEEIYIIFFDDDVETILYNADLPRIKHLFIDRNSISGLGLAFLKSYSWKRLTALSLNYNPVGNRGCKMIKQAGLVLKKLKLKSCLIDYIGIKWICKANLSKLSWFDVRGNSLGDKGCFALSRAHMPNLNGIILKNNQIYLKGIKLLLEAGWAKQAVRKYKYNQSNFQKYVSSKAGFKYDLLQIQSSTPILIRRYFKNESY